MDEKNTELVQTTIKPSVKKKLDKKAASQGHKPAAYVRFLIEKDVKKDE